MPPSHASGDTIDDTKTITGTLEQDSATKVLQGPLLEFTLFPKLPPELRQKIYNDAMPTGTHGYRMLKVTGHIIAPSNSSRGHTLKPEPKPCSIEFALEENAHSASVKDLALSCTCLESRVIFLQRNPLALRTTRERSVIRYAKQDIIYIANFIVVECSVILSLYFDFDRFEVGKIPNLAIPFEGLLDYRSILGTFNQPKLAARKKWHTNSTYQLLSRLQGSGVLGLVWDDDMVSSTFLGATNGKLYLMKAVKNSIEAVRDVLKVSKQWAVENLPEVQILDANGVHLKHDECG